MPEEKVLYSVRLSREDIDKMKHLAKVHDTTATKIIEMALHQYFDANLMTTKKAADMLKAVANGVQEAEFNVSYFKNNVKDADPRVKPATISVLNNALEELEAKKEAERKVQATVRDEMYKPSENL